MGLKLIMIMLAFTYFTAGVSKLRYGGMRWLDGKTLTQSIGTVLPELSGFVLLIPGWPRLLYLLSAIAMHVTIYLLMNLPFLSTSFCASYSLIGAGCLVNYKGQRKGGRSRG